jgi:hypothetical protein
MEPQKFKGMDGYLGAPLNWDESKMGPCLALPVARIDGAVVSAWKPTEVDLAKLRAGEWVFLFVYSGRSMAPVSLVVDKPNPLWTESVTPVD